MVDKHMYTLANEIYELLKKENKTITTAESCTGGLIGGVITSVPGVSSYYKEGVITYSNKAKEKYLGVKHDTLLKYGAVSHQTALEMAEGILKAADADISLAVTGIAGPDGGTDEKPVGLVYIGLAQKGKDTIYEKFIFPGDRDTVRELTIENALCMAKKVLNS
jgi:PncC family amidohydrolase